MSGIPPNIINASLINLKTGDKVTLETKEGSYCHFVPDSEREQFGCYELRFRLDWNDLNSEGDPSLDADLYDNDGKQLDKHSRAAILSDEHHTSRSLNPSQKLYTYHFEKDGVDIEFLSQTTRQATITGTARIVQE